MLKRSAFLLGTASLFLTPFLPQVQAVPATDCCCATCSGCPGGPTGNPGPSGVQGSEGAIGTQGVDGPQGLAGLQGVTGAVGPCCPTSVGSQYASLYSNMAQTIANSPGSNMPGGAVKFELPSTPMATSLIDVSQASSTGVVTVNASGTFRVFFSVQASPASEMAGEDLSFSLFLDGVLVPGSTFSTRLTSAESPAVSHNITGEVIVGITAGQTLQIASSSATSITLTSTATGSSAPINSGSLDLLLLKAF